MSVSLLPIRLGHLRPERTARRHRAVDEVARLRGLLEGAHALIAGLQLQLHDKDQALADTAAKQAEAEEIVVQQQADIDELTEQRDVLRDQLAALRVRFGPELAAEANANAISVPPMVRDTSAIEDQATAPIDVLPLWQALGIGPVTDPGRIH
ncbi:hypothetical protein [Streptomyces sp. NRRL S-813]|uniref:hypothetical protein n=1 Tax=Streptomyces sp. NRRL S-813 TaxID=1463919 RepID=UPI0004BED3C8|nr:hypothetical protein [Streptomyces sp. NRRL S-813]